MVVFAVEKYISRHDLSDNGSEWLRVDQSALGVDRSGSERILLIPMDTRVVAGCLRVFTCFHRFDRS